MGNTDLSWQRGTGGKRTEEREDSPEKPAHGNTMTTVYVPAYNSRRGGIMQTYLCLLRWTKEGVEKVKDSPSRLDAGKKAFAAAGCKITNVLLLMGQYDMAIVVEAPDDATIARMTLALASKG